MLTEHISSNLSIIQFDFRVMNISDLRMSHFPKGFITLEVLLYRIQAWVEYVSGVVVVMMCGVVVVMVCGCGDGVWCGCGDGVWCGCGDGVWCGCGDGVWCSIVCSSRPGTVTL